MICNVYTFSRSYCESKTQGGPSVVEVLRSPPRESIRPRGVDPELTHSQKGSWKCKVGKERTKLTNYGTTEESIKSEG